MTEHNANTPIEDLNGTEDQLDLDTKATPARKKKPAPRRPAQTIEAAIAAGVPTKKLDDLLKAWSKYNTHQALVQAKANADTLAAAVAERRRRIAEALLACADQHGVSIAEARKMFDEALEAKRSGKSK